MEVWTFKHVNRVSCVGLFISQPLVIITIVSGLYDRGLCGAGLRDQQSSGEAPGFKCEESGQEPARPGTGTPRTQTCCRPGRATAGGGGCPAPQHTARAVSTGHSLILTSAAPSVLLPSGTCAFLSDSAQGAHVHHTAQAMRLPLPARDMTSQPPPTVGHVLLLCL